MKRLIYSKTTFIKLILGLMCCQIFIYTSIAYGLSISHTVCAVGNWYGDENPNIKLFAEVKDDYGNIVPNAQVWVFAPDGTRYDLSYIQSMTFYHREEVSILKGPYTFYARLGSDRASPVRRRIVSERAISPPRVILLPRVPQVKRPLTVRWRPLIKANGYFACLINSDTEEVVWSNIADIWQTLPSENSVTIPPYTMLPRNEYMLLVIASNTELIENASAISLTNRHFIPGQPFIMDTSCVTTNTNMNRFIYLSVFLEDYLGRDIDNAIVWAEYPSGQKVPFNHTCNPWYTPDSNDSPNPDDPGSYGTYIFHAIYNEKHIMKKRQLQNYWLPVPKPPSITPWPLERGSGINVNWEPVTGALYYSLDINETVSNYQVYHRGSYMTPSFFIGPDIWQELTPDNDYNFLCHCINAEGFTSATATSFYRVDFTAP